MELYRRVNTSRSRLAVAALFCAAATISLSTGAFASGSRVDCFLSELKSRFASQFATMMDNHRIVAISKLFKKQPYIAAMEPAEADEVASELSKIALAETKPNVALGIETLTHFEASPAVVEKAVLSTPGLEAQEVLKIKGAIQEASSEIDRLRKDKDFGPILINAAAESPETEIEMIGLYAKASDRFQGENLPASSLKKLLLAACPPP
jgi:hypothetical protein